MQISKIASCCINKVRNSAKIGAAAVLLSIPSGTATDSFVKLSANNFTKNVSRMINSAEKTLDSKLTTNFKITQNINSRGGVTNTFDDFSLEQLKKILKNSGFKNTYTHPIDTALHPYIPSTGQFGSPRPQGRAHLGIDIYPRLYGRKPKTPVAVVSATDGIVISVKKSPEHDPKNLIANNIKIMSPDGKIYSYDHLGRPEDYKGAKYTELKKLGEVVHAGDTLGTVGKTGETDVWHLHLGIEDLDAKQKQLKNPVWQDLYKKHGVYAVPRGQVDPLDSTKAGKISNLLNNYKVDKGPKTDYADKL